MKIFGITLRPLHIFLILLAILILVSILLGTNVIEGLTNTPGSDTKVSPMPVYSTVGLDAPSNAPTSVPDFTKPLATGDPNEVGFGVPDGEINLVSGTMNPSEGGNGSGSNIMEAYGPGIPKSQIPKGDEDLYILKSQIVPPVCPACPTVSSCPRKEPCPACPACARCPEPSFDCKKVPNYSSNDDRYLPRPVLADFSQFGM
jgi:hypothetical protein